MDADHVVKSVYLFISIGKHSIHQFYKNRLKSIGLNLCFNIDHTAARNVPCTN